MTLSDAIQWLDQAKAAIRSDRLTEMREAAYSMQSVGIMEGTIDSEMFSALLSVLENPMLHRSKHASKLVMAIQYVWDFLTDEQRDELLRKCREVYPMFNDWSARFVIVDLVGDVRPDRAGLLFLQDLLNLPLAEHRSLVAAGLKGVAKAATDERVRSDAKTLLLEMRADPAADVRNEATEALRGLE